MIKFGKLFTWGEINKMYPDSWIKISADTVPYSPQDKVYVYAVITDNDECKKMRLESLKKNDNYMYIGTDGPLSRQADLEWQFIKNNLPFHFTVEQVPTEDGSIVFQGDLKFYDEK